MDGIWPRQVQGLSVGRRRPLAGGNVEIQPILSMTCALLGGNAALVRIPSGLVDLTGVLMDNSGSKRSGRTADATDFYGGIRSRPAGFAGSDGSSCGRSDDLGREGSRFASSRIAVSPLGEDWQYSDPGYPSRRWTQAPGATRGEQDAWCRRIARDVWQFDQQACSSPQVLFLEKGRGSPPPNFYAM